MPLYLYWNGINSNFQFAIQHFQGTVLKSLFINHDNAEFPFQKNTLNNSIYDNI